MPLVDKWHGLGLGFNSKVAYAMSYGGPKEGEK